jgi:hypothetical protein
MWRRRRNNVQNSLFPKKSEKLTKSCQLSYCILISLHRAKCFLQSGRAEEGRAQFFSYFPAQWGGSKAEVWLRILQLNIRYCRLAFVCTWALFVRIGPRSKRYLQTSWEKNLQYAHPLTAWRREWVSERECVRERSERERPEREWKWERKRE